MAAKLPQVHGDKIKLRAKILREIATESHSAYINSLIDSTDEVLIEEEKRGFMCGLTKTYIRTYISPKFKLEQNKIYKIKIISPYLDGVMGEPITE